MTCNRLRADVFYLSTMALALLVIVLLGKDALCVSYSLWLSSFGSNRYPQQQQQQQQQGQQQKYYYYC